jgi:two-component system nitrogen regulation response regulator GlnG
MTERSEHVWVIDDDRSIRWVLEKALDRANIDVTSFQNASGVLDRLMREQPDAIIADIRMPGMDGLMLMERIHAISPQLPVIIMTAHSDLDSALAAYEGGAFEYLPKPFDVDEATELVKRAIRQRRRHGRTQTDIDTATPEIVGRAPAMQEVFRAIGRLARSNMTVLLTGESGTGKELVARALHRHSPRAQGPFIAINTAAIPRDLLESDLFGHERGAFTGAQNLHRGRFEQADGGTPIRVDVRIIAATHQNLAERVRQHLFREDLYHRLNVIRIHIPALRERREDIPELVRHFLAQTAHELAVEPKTMDSETEAFLSRLDWPGNVRQLENTCRWLTVMSPGQTIHIEDLPPELLGAANESAAPVTAAWEDALKHWAETRLRAGEHGLLDDAVPRFERIMIETTLSHTGGRRQEAARLLGWGRNTLTRKIKELGIAGADTDPDEAED